MRFTKLDIQTGNIETRVIAQKRCSIGGDAASDWRLLYKPNAESEGPVPLPIQFLVEDDGFNLIVTLLSGSKLLAIADVSIIANTPMIWLPEHELRVNDQFIFNQEPNIDRAAMLVDKTSPMKGLIPLFVITFISAVLLTLLLRTIRGKAEEISSHDISPTAPISAPSINSDSVTVADKISSLTDFTPVVTFEPDNTPIATLSNTEKILVTETPTPKVTLTNTVEPIAAAITGIIDGQVVQLEQSNCKPEEKNWIPDRETITNSLGVSYTQTLFQPNYDFFTLYRIEWVNEKDADGRHNIYVDIRERTGEDDSNNQPIFRRVTDRSILVSWGDGSCQRQVQDISDRNDSPWSDYGANCPMEEEGYGYAVQVYSPHSDIVRGLGLGGLPQADQSVDLKEISILSSYLLIFEKRTTNCNNE